MANKKPMHHMPFAQWETTFTNEYAWCAYLDRHRRQSDSWLFWS
jgi:hypothetical protein